MSQSHWYVAFRFSHDELSAAVEEQYCQDEATIKHYIMLEVEYFEAQLKVRVNMFPNEGSNEIKTKLILNN